MSDHAAEQARLAALAREIARLQREYALGLRAIKRAKREEKKAANAG